MVSMKPREVVAYRIKQEREHLGMTQADVAGAVSRLLVGDEKWYPQTVSAAEKGERAFAIDDLFALSLALTVPVEQLITAPPGETIDIGPHQLPGGDEQSGVPVADRLIADVDRSVQALKSYILTGSEVTIKVTKDRKK
jgi:transcriptional regulator with XRE-family HTH domain